MQEKQDDRSGRTFDQGSISSAAGAALVLGIVVSVGFVAAFGAAWFKSFLAGSAPAWIQAVGSVAAILVAGRIASAQIVASRNIELNRRTEDEVKRILIVDALLRSLQSDVLNAEREFEQYPRMPVASYFVERIRASSDAVRGIDLVSCPPLIIQSVLRLYPEPCGTLLQSLDQFKESFDVLEDTYHRCAAGLSNSFTVAKMMLSISRSECEKAVRALRSSSPASAA